MEELRAAYETTQFIVVKLNDEQYGIDIKYIDNIIRMQQIYRVPKVQQYIKGVINLRGEVIPVISIRAKMGFEQVAETKATRIIIVKIDGSDTVGLIVDEVKEVVTLEASQVEKVSYDAKEEKPNYVPAVGKDKGELISLLDLHTLFAEKENS
ncbi:MAG: purine-binding chemotaxis protein CheW [Lachnospiraceae bacterium]|nr:purine-binding chemotaxis protein CheW [Lachnospiraceae bacterium]